MEFMVVLVSYVITGTIFGFITKYIANSKGYDGGFAWGFWLGIIGILVVGFRPNQESAAGSYTSSYSSYSYHEPRASEGGISGYAPRPAPKGWVCVCGSKNPSSIDYCMSCRRTREEATAEKMQCPHCGASNKKTNVTCFACGKNMAEAEKKESVIEKTASESKTEATDFATVLKKIAELHEQGILTDDEFARKKADILEKM